MSQITTHVLDISLGRPAVNVAVILEIQKTSSEWQEAGRGSTDGDGRINNLIPVNSLTAGTYRLAFDTRTYFAGRQIAGLSPQVIIVF